MLPPILHNARAARRALLSIETRTPSAGEIDNRSSESAAADTLDFVASDESLDRFGEIISAAGWQLEAYRRNPVFQNAHQYGDILFTLGKALLTEVRGLSSNSSAASPNPYLFQRIQFATNINPVARIAYGLYKGKFLNAVSVGFIPLRWEDGGAEGAAGRGFRRRYLEQELLEVSAVGLPANPNALALGLKSGAIQKADLEEIVGLLKSLCAPRRLNPVQPGMAQSISRANLHLFARQLHGVLRRA